MNGYCSITDNNHYFFSIEKFHVDLIYRMTFLDISFHSSLMRSILICIFVEKFMARALV